MPLQPSNATVTIDGQKSNAISTNVEVETHHDDLGYPLMGTLKCSINVVVDINDDKNMTFGVLSNLFSLANGVTKDKVKDIKIEFWKDERQNDAVCVYNFRGWISHFSTSSGQDANHTLRFGLQPALDSKQFVKIEMSN